MLLDLVLSAAGLALVLLFAERLVEGVVRTGIGFGLSAFVVGVLFVGFDPENLAVGAAAAVREESGIALGSIVGAAMVAVALAFGITAVLAPMRFGRVAPSVLATPVLAVCLLGALSLDGQLSRLDGALLMVGFAGAAAWFLRLARRGLDIEPGGEVAESLERGESVGRWRAAGALLISLAGIALGGLLLVEGASGIIDEFGLSSTVVGMSALALLVSIEELARELPAARRGRPEISYGNVVGSVLAFFLFNAGLIALVNPVEVDDDVLAFYLPMCLAVVVAISLFLARGRVGRSEGAGLIAAYVAFAVGGYLI